MNVVDLIKQILHGVLIFLIQVLVFRTTTLFGVASCFIYMGFIIQLPFGIPTITQLIITFVYTFAVDLFFDTPGIHTAAAVFVITIRPYILRFLTPSGGYETMDNASIFNMGFQWHVVYAALIILIHCTLVFTIERIGFYDFWNTLAKIFCTTILTVFTIVLYQFLFLYNRNLR